MAALGLGDPAGASSSHRSSRHPRRTRSRDRSYDDDDHYYDARRPRHRDRDRDRRDRSRSYSRSPDRNRAGPGKDVKAVLTAALTAGAAEAYRARKAPGGWTGEKGRRVLTAAIGAGGIGKLLESGSGKNDSRRARSESRGRGGGAAGLAGLATTGMLAAAGKKAFDHYSKTRNRSPKSGYSSDVSNQANRRHKKRSQSMSAYVTKGLAALGLSDEPSDKHRSKRQHQHRRRYDDDHDDYYDDYSDANRPRRHDKYDKYDKRDRYEKSHRY
ncbi:hypothetical protein LOZ43_005468 [Ophidiomyces ophidiicola]|nr:hypothetical protein LOZ43_005468 [Ophidiomyces ophidiicola]